MSTPGPIFDHSLVLAYLGLPEDYDPSPQKDAIKFLVKHLTQLPPHLLLHFDNVTSAKQRTAITTVRNRRLKYASFNPPELGFASARSKWPNLWQGRGRCGVEEGVEEKAWADSDFLRGATKHVGKLGSLLGGYEEEREAERVRMLRRQGIVTNDFVPEEDESSDEEVDPFVEEESDEAAKASFERLIRERFVYGLLEASPATLEPRSSPQQLIFQPFEYNKVDWDESLDSDGDREAEERWFDEEESE